jgi:hypothetical protein
MTRHGPHRLPTQAYQLRAAIPLALHIRNAASMAMIWCEKRQRQEGFSPQNRTSPISASPPITVRAQRWNPQNPKSP